jgi:WD40 repeat protein
MNKLDIATQTQKRQVPGCANWWHRIRLMAAIALAIAPLAVPSAIAAGMGRDALPGGENNAIAPAESSAYRLIYARDIPTQQNAVNSISWSPDGQTLATGGGDGSVKLWTRNGKPIKTFLDAVFLDEFGPHPALTMSISWSPDGETLATGGNGGSVQLWTRNGALVKTLETQQGRVTSVSWSPNGQTLTTGGEDGSAKLWNRNGELVKTLDAQQDWDWVWSVSWSPDGKTLATGGWDDSGGKHGNVAGVDGNVKLWTRNGERVKMLNAQQSWGVNVVSWRPDGETLTTGGLDSSVKFWTRNGELVKTLNTQQGWVRDVSWSPDGKFFATGGLDGSVKLWTRNGELVKARKAHQGRVFSISWHPDGRSLAIGCDDSVLRLWTFPRESLKTFTTLRLSH